MIKYVLALCKERRLYIDTMVVQETPPAANAGGSSKRWAAEGARGDSDAEGEKERAGNSNGLTVTGTLSALDEGCLATTRTGPPSRFASVPALASVGAVSGGIIITRAGEGRRRRGEERREAERN